MEERRREKKKRRENMVTPQEKKQQQKKLNKKLKRKVSENVEEYSCIEEGKDGVLVDADLNEPTIGEKLAVMYVDTNEAIINDTQEPLPVTKPPSADSVHLLLKQALNVDDHSLLLDCLYTQDSKVISNSTKVLSSSDVLKLLNSLIPIVQSRGAVLVCALPWLRSLLLQHASSIISQESSLLALNSLYQLIDSRASTFGSALKLSSTVDLIYTKILDENLEESEKVTPVIYEDNDESDDESEDAMETDQDDDHDHEKAEVSDDVISDVEGMSDS